MGPVKPDGRQVRPERLFSATTLLAFLGCRHATFLDLSGTGTLDAAEIEVDGQAELLQRLGLEHEVAYLASLKDEGLRVVEIAGRGIEERVAQTTEAMRRGAQIIYQGALLAGRWHGYADFLLRVDMGTNLGPFGYEVADTKLSRSVKPQHAIQLSIYSHLLGLKQGVLPRSMHLILGDRSRATLQVRDYSYYTALARDRLEAFAAAIPDASSGEPCAYCGLCRWEDSCAAAWEAADHLSLVAGIMRSQIRKLRDDGIETVRTLGGLPDDHRVPALNPDTLERLRHQARLQTGKRDTGENRVDVLPAREGKGFARLPRPSPGDLFFDMEGDPLFEGGLEYLFGFVHQEAGVSVFTPFWAHDREREKEAFEEAIDFMTARLTADPAAHVYHYAPYEETALKRLAMLHGTREVEVDDILRGRRLVDLYKVVREGIRISEPRYSLKNLEAFYMEKREGDVKTAGDSIVVYEAWRLSRDPVLLERIGSYNKDDCVSTLLCRKWLLSLRPADIPWFTAAAAAEVNPDREDKRREAEARTARYVDALTAGAAAGDRPWRELLAHMLEFHRREAKPEWWAMFSRQDMTEEELVEDAEAIGQVRLDPSRATRPEKRSTVSAFRFPPQDFKLRVGDCPLLPDTLEPAGEIVSADDVAFTLELKRGPKKPPLPDVFSLIPAGPIGDEVLRAAIYRYADSVLEGTETYPAITGILRRDRPRLAGRGCGRSVLEDGAEPLAGAVEAIGLLDGSHMLVQGPPGAGKTFTASHAIIELLRRGNRVGVASNSHKAVNNVLAAVESVAAERRIRFTGIKKSSNEDQFFRGATITDTCDNGEAEGGVHGLVAGTAWLFAREKMDRRLDWLFVDEAGQVSLANIVAMGVSARNIVLVGDQMQLSQPIQGTHPGNSGLSALEHLLGELATVPPDRGIFLATTRRMHPALCRFISEAVYDGRLDPHPDNANQGLLLGSGADSGLARAGLCFVEVEHEGCSQKSEAEAGRLRAMYMSLLRQRWTDRTGAVHPVGIDDILVVSPFNMQVNHLRSVLPDGARVGTVDKFQGQEANVVLISMATSSAEELSRGIEFLFSRNRLNVAISRARALTVVFASPKLLEVPCSTVEQMRLVNTLCWVRRFNAGDPSQADFGGRYKKD